MCGRFVLFTDLSQIQKAFNIETDDARLTEMALCIGERRAATNAAVYFVPKRNRLKNVLADSTLNFLQLLVWHMKDSQLVPLQQSQFVVMFIYVAGNLLQARTRDLDLPR